MSGSTRSEALREVLAAEGRPAKSTFGPGPWQTEPDREEWRHADLPCLIVRGPLGALCGYVAVPPGHPYHGKDWDDAAIEVGVHGGLTYADRCQGEICHVPGPGEPDNVWWFGFDCAHAGDHVPGLFRSLLPGETYRDLAYVRAQVNRLAEQLAAVRPEPPGDGAAPAPGAA